MSNAGRKSKYDTIVKHQLPLIKMWLREGATEKQIYEKLGVSHNAWNEYKKKYHEFNEIIKDSRELADAIIENALFNEAKGYYYHEDNKDGKEIRKYARPSTTAQIWWLKNRKHTIWRDRQENVNINVNEEHTQATREIIDLLKGDK